MALLLFRCSINIFWFRLPLYNFFFLISCYSFLLFLFWIVINFSSNDLKTRSINQIFVTFTNNFYRFFFLIIPSFFFFLLTSHCFFVWFFLNCIYCLLWDLFLLLFSFTWLWFDLWTTCSDYLSSIINKVPFSLFLFRLSLSSFQWYDLVVSFLIISFL